MAAVKMGRAPVEEEQQDKTKTAALGPPLCVRWDLTSTRSKTTTVPDSIALVRADGPRRAKLR